MKKRALAILMILVLATAGLFATYNATLPGNVTATLNATIGNILLHGFNVDGAKYQSSVIVDDAFGVNAPSFKYGYRTNGTGDFTIKMAVGDFINQTVTGTVKIKSVSSNQAMSAYSSTTGYTVFNTSTSGLTGGDVSEEAVITIYPAKASSDTDHRDGTTAVGTAFVGDGGAAAGSYVSVITFSITSSI